jgi:O-antigen/teichoic acid export membrane protein
LNEADKIIVAREAGMHDAGIYAAAAALAAIMMTFNQSLTNALYPEMFRRLAEGRLSERAIVGQYAVRFVAFASAFCAIALGGYFLVADMLLPQRYLGGRAVFIALMLAGITVSFYRPFGLVAEYLRWGRIRAVAISIGGLLAVAVGLLGVRTGELVWAPAGIAVGYVCAALILAARLLRRVDKA